MSVNATTAHTNCCGTEPYDKCFGVGAKRKLDSGGFSPHERINKLRELNKTTLSSIDSVRAVVFTEVYKQNESQPIIIKKARALAKYLEVCPLHYEEGELLLMDDGTPIMGSPVYVEYMTWIYDELRNKPLYERDYDPVTYDEKVKEEILSVEDYWKGKTIKEAFAARISEEAAKGCIMTGTNIFNPMVNVDQGIGHLTPDYDYALKKGLRGMKEHICACRDKIGNPSNYDEIKTLQFYEAQLIVLEAISTYFRRYAEFAKEKANEYSSQQTKEELMHMSRICSYLAEEPARDFWEAIQFVYMINAVLFMESNAFAIALGRMDQYLHPYYKKSLEKGIYTKSFMEELIECLYLKVTSHGMLMENTGTDQWRGGTRGYSGTAIIVGGVDREGNDATNDLSFMLLDAMIHLRIQNPFPTVRWHEGTPYELKIKVAEAVRLGIGHPKLLNDKSCMDAMMRQGVSLEDARDYVNIGCVELEIPGKTLGWHDNTYFTLPKVLELALNNGRCLDCMGEYCPNFGKCRGAGKALGLETGYLKDFKTYKEVQEAFEAQLKYWADLVIPSLDLIQAIHSERDDYPFTSTLISDCTENGKSLNKGGARYNFTGINCLGPATVADSLTALKQVVYEEKKYTPEEFYDALTKNWEGYERLYQLVNSEKVHHYGNDDDYADDMMKYVFDTYCDLLTSYPPTRGGIGKIKPGAFSQILNVMSGAFCGATPDGRKHHEAISENIGAARTAHSGRDISGPTAYARSVGKIDHAKGGSGTLINMKFGVDTISGENGRNNFIDFVDGYFSANPLHIQFMVADKETLIEAQKKPEEYQDILVRVSGFSSYFHTLSRSFQDELINRTEHSFD